jgi:hypothetical protein
MMKHFRQDRLGIGWDFGVERKEGIYLGDRVCKSKPCL